MTATSASAPAALHNDAEFTVPATATLFERRPRVLKHGDTFAVFDSYGDIVSRETGTDGLYHADTRYLSRLQLLLNGRRPLLLSSTVQDNNAVLTVDLTNPEIAGSPAAPTAQSPLPRDTLHVVRSKFLWQAACYERIAVRNFGDHPLRIELDLLHACDFADLFEVRGARRPRRGRLTIAPAGPDSLLFSYAGLDAAVRHARLSFDPPPDVLQPEFARFVLTIEPGARRTVLVSVRCSEGEPPEPDAGRFFVALRRARHALIEQAGRAAAVETSNQAFNEVAQRAMADIAMLMTDTPHGPYPYAGIPWFSTAFGRDGIITALELLWLYPEAARGVLRFLAATQARAHDPAADAEPGKILHETRGGEMARLGEVPFGLYYGSVDSTPLFVVLAGAYFERTGDRDAMAALWPSLEAALAWIDEHGDRDRDGFVEYDRQTPSGLANQGWKDSHDAVFHADGRLAEGPIALCEVQGYVYAARRHAATIAAALGRGAVAAALERQAEALRATFETAFWCPELGTYALALDGDKRPCRVRSSNAGQLLFTGIAAPERARAVADQMLSSRFFSGWGIRTIAEGEARYNPMAYHDGSVWPHDNALIALGLARCGMTGHVLRLFRALFDAAGYMELRRLPELFCGFPRLPGRGPTLYPVACSPQAWASGAPFALLQACLGMSFDRATGDVSFRHPRLPDFLDHVVIRGLRSGGSTLDVMLRRFGSDVSINVLGRTGPGGVVVTL